MSDLEKSAENLLQDWTKKIGDALLSTYIQFLVAMGIWKPEPFQPTKVTKTDEGYIVSDVGKTYAQRQEEQMKFYETTEQAKRKPVALQTPEEKTELATRKSIEEEGYIVSGSGVYSKTAGGDQPKGKFMMI